MTETLISSVWRTCFTFFETVEDGRVHSCFKKRSRLAKRKNCAFPGGTLISVFLLLCAGLDRARHEEHAGPACGGIPMETLGMADLEDSLEHFYFEIALATARAVARSKSVNAG
ncbi:hypothetical protein [Desulfovibrio sp. 86]|uniref:Uncharacterized protein n=1 Tax=uncultured Desulfovibrio sp. TaxID=167968 RepID=A0A212L3K4_9BACT|nr:hypothetical protein [Desulfovibrio sp. 86]SCM72096.1 hypothetical protein KL86DES1_20393 [uncultured Desulfovibrio sp.]VZH33296.1 conserved protein of unknown function [Desulfovibrio sp. 86]